jgi:hypothetical protein
MNEELIAFIISACVTIFAFGWDYYKIKHGKYNIPDNFDIHTPERWIYNWGWRWVYNWGWMTFGITIIKFIEFIETL